ncbi:MAG: RC-LH1 core complex protein PufX [Pseudomonadota bacterium]
MTKHVIDKDDTTVEERRTFLLFDIAGQMARGVVVGGTVFFGPVLFIYAVYLLGTLLPEESKEAQDPTPDSFIAASQDGS